MYKILFPIILGAVKVTIKLVACTVTPSKVTLAWSKSVSKEYLNNKIQLYIDDECVNGEWESCTGYEYDDLWILKHSHKILTKSHIKVTIVFKYLFILPGFTI